MEICIRHVFFRWHSSNGTYFPKIDGKFNGSNRRQQLQSNPYQQESIALRQKIKVRHDGQIIETDVMIKPNSCTFVYFSEVLPKLRQSKTPEILSWMLRTEADYFEAFWTAYTPDGRICGEHGF